MPHKDPEARRACSAAYRRANREAHRAYNAAYRRANCEALAAKEAARRAARSHAAARAENIFAKSATPRMTAEMLKALDEHALYTAEGFGVEPFADCWKVAASYLLRQPGPYEGDHRLGCFTMKNAEDRLSVWRNGGKRRNSTTPQEEIRAEVGICRAATFRKDRTVTIAWQARVQGIRANFPTIHLARGWRALAKQAVADGLTPRHVRRDAENYPALLAAAPDLPEPTLPEPVNPLG